MQCSDLVKACVESWARLQKNDKAKAAMADLADAVRRLEPYLVRESLRLLPKLGQFLTTRPS